MKPQKSTLLDLLECQKSEISKIEAKINNGVSTHRGDSCGMSLFHAKAYLSYLEVGLSELDSPTEWECVIQFHGQEPETVTIATEDSDLPDEDIFYYVKNISELRSLQSRDVNGLAEDFIVKSIG